MIDVPALLARLDLPPVVAEELGSPALTLTRSWPRSDRRLLLEFSTPDGRRIAGQWFADHLERRRVAEATADSGPVHELPDDRIVLQPDGADRRLTALAALVADDRTELLVHRPERRAVLRRRTVGGLDYLKVVTTDRVGRLVAGAATSEAEVSAPRLLGVDWATGVTTWSEVPGVPWHDLLGTGDAVAAAREVGRAIRRLHDLPLPDRFHGPSDEADVVRRWFTYACAFAPSVSVGVREALRDVEQRLRSVAVERPVLVHRDLHDKQVLVDGSGVGILDLDTICAGDAALDVGNVLAHLELRFHQGRCRDPRALVDAFLDGYDPDAGVLARLPVYVDAARVRLVLVYAFRPRWRTVTKRLAAA